MEPTAEPTHPPICPFLSLVQLTTPPSTAPAPAPCRREGCALWIGKADRGACAFVEMALAAGRH